MVEPDKAKMPAKRIDRKVKQQLEVVEKIQRSININKEQFAFSLISRDIEEIKDTEPQNAQ